MQKQRFFNRLAEVTIAGEVACLLGLLRYSYPQNSADWAKIALLAIVASLIASLRFFEVEKLLR